LSTKTIKKFKQVKRSINCLHLNTIFDLPEWVEKI